MPDKRQLWSLPYSPRKPPHLFNVLLWAGGKAYLVVFLKADPDSLSLLKCVEQLDYLEKRPVTLIRIFDPDSARSGEIRDFASLDQRPELIIYEGYSEIQGGEIEIFPLNEPFG